MHMTAYAEERAPLPRVKQPKTVPVEKVQIGGSKKPDMAAKNAWKGVPEAAWPAAGLAEVELAAGKVVREVAPAKPARAGGLPVSLAPAEGTDTPAKRRWG